MIERRVFESRADYERFVLAPSPSMDKDDLIVALCQGRRVLDIGCIDHDLETVDKLGASWLHGRIKQVASELTGLDILEAEAAELNKRGFHIECADAHDFDLGRRFDLVVAGNIIEHMTDVGRFLRAVARHLEPDGVCVVTTPNPFDIFQMANVVIRQKVTLNIQHTVWFDPTVLWEQVSRTPLRISGFAWTITKSSRARSHRLRGKIARALMRFMRRRRPILNSDFAVLLSPTP